jgi:hypothetical protein
LTRRCGSSSVEHEKLRLDGAFVSDIFISYSQADRECAYEMLARLEAQGLKCWIAPRDITPSADWAAEIIDAISSARFLLLVFSSSSNQSPQVRREVERAVHKGVTLLPFRIEDVVPSKSLEFFLSAQHWMDAFPPPREVHYRTLCSYLRAQLALPPGIAVPIPIAQVERSSTVAEAVSPRQRAHIEAQLAFYIGPLAGFLVKREAQQAAGAEDLIARLSIELEAESDRTAFAQRCRVPPGAG